MSFTLINGNNIANTSNVTVATLTTSGVATFTAQPILSSLTASKPVFTDASKGLVSTGTLAYDQGGTGQTSYAAGDIIYASGVNTLAKLAVGTTGQHLIVSGGVPSWSTDATIGTVTSVGWTGGIVSVATATTTPAFTIAGTSGGIPYFSSASTWATSAALAANALVIGGGAGVAPATTTTGTGVVTALGVNTGTAGAFVVNGGALGTPSGGTVTNLTGTASININGTVGATTPAAASVTTLSASSTVTVTGTIKYGTGTTTTAGLQFSGQTGGYATIIHENLTPDGANYAFAVRYTGQETWINTITGGTIYNSLNNTTVLTSLTSSLYTINTPVTISGTTSVGVAANTTSLGGTYSLLTVGAASGSGIVMGQTDLTATNSTAAQFLGKTTGASGYQLLGGMLVQTDGTSSTNAVGRLLFYTATGGSLTERMRINSTGALGLAVTPQTWNSDYAPMQLGPYGTIVGRVGNNELDIFCNVYRDAAGAFRYLNNGFAVAYAQINGENNFYSAASGTAGNVATLNSVLTISTAGAVTIPGTLGVTGALTVTAASVFQNTLVINGSGFAASPATNSGALYTFQSGGLASTGGIEYQYATSGAGYGFKIASSSATDQLLIGYRSNSATWTSGFALSNTGAVTIPGNLVVTGQSATGRNIDATGTAGAQRIRVQDTTTGSAFLEAWNSGGTNALTLGVDSNAGGLTGTANQNFIYGSGSLKIFTNNGSAPATFSSTGSTFGTAASPAIILNGNSTGNLLKMIASASGTRGDATFQSWYRANGTTRKGYFGFGSADSQIIVLGTDEAGGSIQFDNSTAVTGTLYVSGTSGYGPRATASSTDRISVSTSATTLSNLTTGGSVGATVALFIVNGYNTASAGNSFCDIVAFVAGATPSTISAIAKGSPAARTYSASGSSFQLAMASGTYNVAVTQFEQSC